ALRSERPAGARLVGVFFVLGVLVLGKDLQSFTEKLTSLTVGGDVIAYPVMAKLAWIPLRVWLLVLGLVIALGLAVVLGIERCQLHRELGGKPYYVVEDRNVRSLLLSNKVDGTSDKNPLREMILHEPPKQIPMHPKGRVVFDNKIELLGWDMPKSVGRGSKF